MASDGDTACVVGLGNLGMAIAENLSSQGWLVHGVDTSTSRLDAAAEFGVMPVDLGEIDDRFVCVVVPDDESVESLCAQDLAGLAHGSLVIVHSSIRPHTAQSCSDKLAEHGVGFLDAPVSGGAERARQGDLTLMVGGSPANRDAAKHLLAAQASTVINAGDVGAGAAMKLAHQIALFATLGGLLEGIQFAGQWGVSEDALREAVGTGLAQSWVSTNWGFYDRLFESYETSQTNENDRPWKKDLQNALDSSDARTLPITDALANTLPSLVTAHALQARVAVR